MVEVSKRGIKDEELELDLGLSIGSGSFRRSEKSNLNGVDPRGCEIKTAAVGLSSDPQTKREVQALRRQEAKRKREEKRSRGGRGGRSEPQEVGERLSSPPVRKKEKSSEPTNNNILLSQGSENLNLNFYNVEREQQRYPVQSMQHPYLAPVQFVQYTNGLTYPCVVPCWAPSGGNGFRPFQANQNNGCNNTEQNGAAGGKVVKSASLSNGSPICSTSTISDHYSTASHEGGGSSDTRSQSSLLNGAIAKDNKAQSDHTATSHPIESKAQPKEKSAQPAEPAPVPVSYTEDCPPTPPPPTTTTTTSAPLKETKKMEPPKTQNSEKTKKTPATPQMPYVSTTGNGPNGTTIHGFLYRYSKSEISIVCVCHGSTFSPAEFVQHAGGTDLTQPLRHITVIPSAFG